MAKISLGQFEDVQGPRGVITGAPGLSGTLAVGRAAEQLGNTIAEGAMRIQQANQQKIAQDEQETRALNQVKMLNATADHDLSMRAAAAQTQEDLASGNVTWSTAPEKFETRLSAIAPMKLDGLDPVQIEQYNGAVAQNRRQASFLIDGVVRQAKTDDGKGQWGATLDRFGKLAGLPGADIDKINATVSASVPTFATFGIDTAVLTKQAQEFADKNWRTQAEMRITGALENPAELAKIRDELTKDDGYYATRLDADVRGQAARVVINRLDTLENKAIVQADRAEARQTTALDQMDRQVSTGVPPTLEQRTSWAAMFPPGSPRRAEYDARVKGYDEVQALARMPIAEQRKAVADKRAAMMVNGGDQNDQANLARMEAGVEARYTMLTKDPLQWAATHAATPVEPITPEMILDPSQSGALGALLNRRAVTIGAVRKQHGSAVRDTLLTKEDTTILSTVLDAMPRDKRLQALGHLSGSIGNEATYDSVLQQLAPDSPVTARAGQLQAISRRYVPDKRANGGVSPNVALTMLLGEEQMNKSKSVKATDGKPVGGLPMPKDAEIVAVFTETVGEAFAGDAGGYDEALQWARSYYAGRMIEPGKLTDVIDEDLVRESIRATVGGVMEFNGSKVIVPFGMDEDAFETTAKREIFAQTTEHIENSIHRHTAQKNARLVKIGKHRYALAVGGQFIKRKDDKPITIEIKK